MKFVRYATQGDHRLGVLDEEAGTISPLAPDVPGAAAADLVALITAWQKNGPSIVRTEEEVPLTSVRLTAPIPHPPRNIFCVGKNYHEHAGEFAASGFDATGAASPAADRPIIFTKPDTAIAGPGDVIESHSTLTQSLDYEAEMAVIVGRGGRQIRPEDALDHVWGYTLVNDITARDLQRNHKQWFMGKSLDGSCPMGPWAVTRDELAERDVVLECRVNGELRQRASTRDLVFDVPTLLATLSAGMTLRPGDIIATGTPAGVGIGFDPPRFLEPDDEIVVTATGLGELTTRVGEADHD